MFAMRPTPDRLTLLTAVLLLLVAAAAWGSVIVQATAMQGMGDAAR